MDATDSIDIDQRGPGGPEPECGPPAAPSGGCRRLRVRTGAPDRSVVSHLGSDEPVTDAEIRLILGCLGDIITSVLNEKPSCPTSPPLNGA
jgi:hypothetical protein